MAMTELPVQQVLKVFQVIPEAMMGLPELQVLSDAQVQLELQVLLELQEHMEQQVLQE
jgi:hypothetical protein